MDHDGGPFIDTVPPKYGVHTDVLRRNGEPSAKLQTDAVA
jgi:hypothetical protein